MFNLIEGLS